MRYPKSSILLAGLGLLLAASRADAVDYTTAQPLSSVITTPVKDCGKFTELPVPMIAWGGDMATIYANGSTETVRLPVEIWLLGNHYLYERKFATDVVKVEIDPGQNFPDVRRENNVWTKS